MIERIKLPTCTLFENPQLVIDRDKPNACVVTMDDGKKFIGIIKGDEITLLAEYTEENKKELMDIAKKEAMRRLENLILTGEAKP